MLDYKDLVRLNQIEVETSVQPLSPLYKTINALGGVGVSGDSLFEFKEPCELQKCIFKLEDAMSVHAMYSSGLSTNVSPHHTTYFYVDYNSYIYHHNIVYLVLMLLYTPLETTQQL